MSTGGWIPSQGEEIPSATVAEHRDHMLILKMPVPQDRFVIRPEVTPPLRSRCVLRDRRGVHR